MRRPRNRPRNRLRNRLRNRPRKQARILLAAGMVAALAVLTAGCGSSASSGDEPLVSGVTTSDHDGYEGIVMPTAFEVGDTTLTTDDRQPFSMRRDTAGRLTLTFFGYTHCPDVCQIVMGTIASAYARLDPEQRKKVQVLFVTTDPARDTPAALKAYLARLNPGFVGLTGSLDTINATATPFHVFLKKGRKLHELGLPLTSGGQGAFPIRAVLARSMSGVGVADDVQDHRGEACPTSAARRQPPEVVDGHGHRGHRLLDIRVGGGPPHRQPQ